MAQEINTIAGRLYRKDDVARSREAHQAFLRGLPDNFRIAAAAVNATNPEDLVRACVQMSAVLDMDEREVGVSKGRVNNVASSDRNGQENGQENNNSQRSGYNNSQRSGYSGSRDFSKVQCWKCKEFGHFSRNCKVKVKCHKCGWSTHLTEFCRMKPKLTNAGNEQKSQ
jgi:ribosomal protein S27E